MVRRAHDPRRNVTRREDVDDLPDLSDLAGPAQAAPCDRGVRRSTLKKQVSVLVPLEDWTRLRDYAAQRKLSLVDVCRRLLAPGFEKLRDGRDPLGE